MLNKLHPILRRLVLLVVLDLLILFKVPIISDLSGLVFLFWLPGFYILDLINFKKEGWENFLHSITLSISFVLLGGLLSNFLLPLFGSSQPLNLHSIMFVLNILIIGLSVFRFCYIKRPINIYFRPSISPKVILQVVLAGILPLMAIAGANIINNGGPNHLTLLMIFSIVLVVLALFITKKDFSENTLLTVLFSSALSLLLMTSMRGWFINGYDIHHELLVFNLTKTPLLWSMAHFESTYNACLSITLLPTIFSQFIAIQDEYIFKFFFQIMFAFMPLVIYFIVRKFQDKKIAFLAAFFFMSQLWFFQEMPTLIRQEFGLIFFGLILLTLFSNIQSRLTKYTLLLMYALGMVVSHYSTSYIAIFIFLVVYALNGLLRLIRSRTTILTKPVMTINISFIFIMIVFSSAFIWNVLITKSLGNFSKVVENAMSNIREAFDPTRINDAIDKVFYVHNTTTNFATYKTQRTENFQRSWRGLPYYNNEQILSQGLNLVSFPTADAQLGDSVKTGTFEVYRFVKILINNAFILFGTLYLIYFWLKGKFFSSEYLLFSLTGYLLMITLILIPGLSNDYNIERLFLQLFVVWSYVGTFGGFTLLRIFRLPVNVCLAILAVLFSLQLLFYTGSIFNFTGGPALMPLHNFGEGYEKLYTLPSDVSGARWLSSHFSDNFLIYASGPARNKLYSYGDVRLVPKIVPETLPGVISRNSYVFTIYMNNIGKRGLYVDNGITYPYSFPTEFLNRNKNLIYSNSTSKIYR